MFAFLTYCIFWALYTLLMLVCLYHFVRTPKYIANDFNPVFISVIIAARNEEENISNCLDALLQQEYPKEMMEILVVDDLSSDNTCEVILGYADKGVRLIRIEKGDVQFGKKAAIDRGIKESKGELIMVTDADCTMGKKWINTVASFYLEKGSAFIVLPVKYRRPKSFLDIFQSLDFMSLQGITAAGVSGRFLKMCNGANLVYTKKAFQDVNGFQGVDKIPTGDDMLLMEKISAAFPEKVHYCLSEDVIVETSPAADFSSFMQQRIRWASKSTVYKSVAMKLTLLLVYLLNAVFVGLIIASLIDASNVKFLLLCWLMKTLSEIFFMIKVSNFFNQRKLIWMFPIMQPFHALYTVAAGTFGWVGKYKWKGRGVEG